MHPRLGFGAAVLTTVVTATFAIAGVATPARSGPFCATWGCVPAPYTDVAAFVPGDYLWLIPGMLLVPVFLVLVACVHDSVAEPRRIHTRVALAFATVYAVVIGVDYFTQFAVVMPSLEAGETDGLSLVTQYNPHGLFIAGEVLGYLAMSIALLSLAPAFAGRGVERALRWLFIGGFILVVAMLAALWVLAGDLVAVEVSILSIDWIVLVASGVLLAILFRRAGHVTRDGTSLTSWPFGVREPGEGPGDPGGPTTRVGPG